MVAEPNAGYTLDHFTVDDEPLQSNTFIMPESNVTVSAVFSPVYNISIDMALVGGSISQMSTQGTLTAYPAGTQVFLSAIPDTDYSFVENSFIVTRADGETGPTVTYTNMMYSFIMPESNVTVSATFNKTAFAVSQVVTPMYSGSFAIDKTAHVETGETVTLSNFNAYEGYYFDFEDVNSLVVKRNDNQETVEVNNYGNIYQFAMPTSDVTVTATFKDLPRYEVVIGTVTNGTVTFSYDAPDDHKYMSGETVYLEVNPASSDYTLESITATPSEGSAITPQPYYGGPTYYFTMPDFESEESTVTVTATFREFNTYTINYYVNGQLDRTMQCKEDGLVNNDGPQNVAVPAGMTYEGWGVAEIGTYATEKPAIIGDDEHPTHDYDLHAVLSYEEEQTAKASGSTWQKVISNSDVQDGDNVIIVGYYYGGQYYTMLQRESADAVVFKSSNSTILEENLANGLFDANTTIFNVSMNNGNMVLNYIDAFAGATTLAYNDNGLVPATMGVGNEWIAYGGYNGEIFSSDWAHQIKYGSNAFKFEGGYLAYFYKEVKSAVMTQYYMTEVLTEGDVTENTTAKNIVITTGTVTVDNDIVLTMNENGLFRNENAANFVFEDGAQLIYDGDETVNATMKKNITGTEWYTISSPLANSVEFANVTNLIPSNVTDTVYDLYRLNEAEGIWENARIYGTDGETIIANPDFTTIDKGLGYIYANNAGADHIAFAGEVNVADVDVKLSLTADKGKGFNLIGNPFTQSIELANVTGVTLAEGFYVLSNEGDWGSKLTSSPIKPLQGFLVQATTAGQATISKHIANKGERSGHNTNIEMIVSNSNHRDNAYAVFGEGIGLNKVNHRNAEAPMLYVPQDGEKFAIAFMDENTTVFPLNFKAMTTGKYSISLKATDDINTLVLVDNMTGVETNMLLENSYSFNGSPADSDGRFTVKLSISHSNGQSDNEHFVYQNGKELVVNGEGSLQIFDVLGRVVISEEVHGQTVYVGNLSEGAYIVRMTGNEVKTQKIIIR